MALYSIYPTSLTLENVCRDHPEAEKYTWEKISVSKGVMPENGVAHNADSVIEFSQRQQPQWAPSVTNRQQDRDVEVLDVLASDVTIEGHGQKEREREREMTHAGRAAGQGSRLDRLPGKRQRVEDVDNLCPRSLAAERERCDAADAVLRIKKEVAEHAVLKDRSKLLKEDSKRRRKETGLADALDSGSAAEAQMPMQQLLPTDASNSARVPHTPACGKGEQDEESGSHGRRQMAQRRSDWSQRDWSEGREARKRTHTERFRPHSSDQKFKLKAEHEGDSPDLPDINAADRASANGAPVAPVLETPGTQVSKRPKSESRTRDMDMHDKHHQTLGTRGRGGRGTGSLAARAPRTSSIKTQTRSMKTRVAGPSAHPLEPEPCSILILNPNSLSLNPRALGVKTRAARPSKTAPFEPGDLVLVSAKHPSVMRCVCVCACV